MRRFLHRLWYAQREIYVEQLGELLPVDWPAGKLDIEIAGNQSYHLAVWLVDGRVIGLQGHQPIRIHLQGELPAPARGLTLEPYEDPAAFERLQIDGTPMLARIFDDVAVPVRALIPRGWVPHPVARWRLLWRGIRDALRWAPHREERP
jgi:hypothetical protein